MELRDYLVVLRRRWLQIVAVTAITVFAALASTVLVPPRWESQVMLRVAPTSVPATSYEAVVTAEMLAKTYRELVASDYVAAKAMELLFARGDVASFRRDIDVELIPDTQLIQVIATGRSPERARAKAAAVSDAAIGYAKTLGAGDEIKVVIPATLPDRAAWPRPMVALVVGVVFGGLLGVALAVAFDYLGARVERSPDIEEKLGLTVIGQIPALQGLGPHPNAFTMADGLMAEHFRHLRTAILYSMDGQKLDSLVVTSSEPRQGKTVVSVNLAMSVARTGKRVILADADMRMPTMHRFFGVENGLGLSDFLHGSLALDDLLVESGFDSLVLVTAGQRPEEPSELLGSARLTDFLRQARQSADLVIIDSPPAVTVTDSVILAARADGVLLVVERRQRIESVRRAINSLARVGARIVGVVFNRTDVNRSARKHGYYYVGSPGGPAAESAPDPSMGTPADAQADSGNRTA